MYVCSLQCSLRPPFLRMYMYAHALQFMLYLLAKSLIGADIQYDLLISVFEGFAVDYPFTGGRHYTRISNVGNGVQ